MITPKGTLAGFGGNYARRAACPKGLRRKPVRDKHGEKWRHFAEMPKQSTFAKERANRRLVQLGAHYNIGDEEAGNEFSAGESRDGPQVAGSAKIKPAGGKLGSRALIANSCHFGTGQVHLSGPRPECVQQNTLGQKPRA